MSDTPGAFAERMVVSAHAALPVDDLDQRTAVLVEPLAVACRAVRRARVGVGDRVLVVGGGPIGLAVTLWCRHAGAREVVVSDPSSGRRAMAEHCGASQAVDPTGTTARGAWRAAGMVTAPDVVIECVGRSPLVQECLDALGRHGRFLVAGLHTAPVEVTLRRAFFHEVEIGFSTWYEREEFAITIDALRSGALPIDGFVTSVVGLDDLPQTFELLRAPTDECKVAVDPSFPSRLSRP
jgi:(R,R)-butanediol dehydrogenase/meso-butanediol dehydrogenase/diacetyl reductase